MIKFTLKGFGIMLLILGLGLLCVIFWMGKKAAERERDEIRPKIERQYRDYVIKREDSIRKVERIRFDSLAKVKTGNKERVKIIYKNIKNANDFIDNANVLDSLWKNAGY